MRLVLRFVLPLLLVLMAMAGAVTPLVNSLMNRWFQSDVEMRSRLIFNSIQGSLPVMVRESSHHDLETLFNRIAEDERVLAVGWCSADGAPVIASVAWPLAIGCHINDHSLSSPVFRTERIGQYRHVLYAAFTVGDQSGPLGQLVILHDLAFIANRSLHAEFYLALFLGLLGIGAAGVTVLTAQITVRGWVRSVRRILNTPSGGRIFTSDSQIAPLISEIRQMLRDLDISRRTAAGVRMDWSPQTLRFVLDNELPGAEVIVVSNREPYIHNRDDQGQVILQRPASGLVTAFEPIMRACGGTWVAHGSGTADREFVDAQDRIAVPPDNTAYKLRRIWLSTEEEAGYYYGFANEGLWPLCHITFVRPTFRQPDWEQYVAVNSKFADAVASEATRPDPIILVQDYHFALLPRMLRQRLPQATIITFWHIPWPNPEVFSVCPWREEIINGLLGSSIVGFHTQLHCNNFIDSADRFIECHINRENSALSVGGQTTSVRPYPISVAWPPPPLASVGAVKDCRAAVIKRHSLPAHVALAVGIERFDFTKGIADRFRAVELLLANHPEWIGRFVMLQVAAPTRSELSLYKDIQREVVQLATQINARFGRPNYQPIVLIVQHHEPEQVYELFRAADICIVSSLHDGMNLVAKEFIAARDDEQGVLVLSTFAGASRELMEAILVNPFDARATAEALNEALRMPHEQQAERMRLMRDFVRENNVYYWAGRMLLDAARIRKRSRINSVIEFAARANSDEAKILAPP